MHPNRLPQLLAQRITPLAVAIGLGLAWCAPVQAQALFTTIPGIPGYGTTRPNAGPAAPQYGDVRGWNWLVPLAISADGSSVAGTQYFRLETYSFYRGCRLICDAWMPDGGGAQAFVWSGQATTGLGYTSNATGQLMPRWCDRIGCGVGIRESIATGISADGRVVVGYGRTWCLWFCPSPPLPEQAFVWTAAGGLQEIGGVGSRAVAVSGDGRVVLGWSGSAGSFSWTSQDGLRPLEGTRNALSFDGRVMVGSKDGIAMRWDAQGAARYLGMLAGDEYSSAADVSFDGSVVAGSSGRVSGSAPSASTAFLWTATTGIVSLGYLAGDTHSAAAAISGNGQVIVGTSYRYPTQFAGSQADTAFRWTTATGMQSVASWLAAGGVPLPVDVVLRTATDTNYNGNVVIGTYRRTGGSSGTFDSFDSYGYLARVGGAGSGFIADMDVFRLGITEAGLQTLDAAALLPSAAAGTARRHGGWNATVRADARGCGWISAARTRYRGSGPDVETQEVGACVQAGPLLFAAGTGRLDARQTWSTAGGSDVDGRYTLLGVGSPLGPLQVSLAGYRGDFDAVTARRYANGNGTDVSAARPEGDFRAAVLRLDWSDMVRRGRMGVSPYLLGAWSTSGVEAYAETGGGFPVAYEAASVDSRELALGVFADFYATQATSIGIGLESNRRRVDTGDGVGARVVELFDASTPGTRADDVDSHVQLRIRHAFGRAWHLQAHARNAIDSEERDMDLGVQLIATF